MCPADELLSSITSLTLPVPAPVATFKVLPPPIGSCEGMCGKLGPALGNCWCDGACAFQGDCCSDYKAWCVDLALSPPPGPAGAQSVGKAGVADAVNKLWQNQLDSVTPPPSYHSLVGLPLPHQPGPPPPANNLLSCANHCGLFTGLCFCDASCIKTNDCCHDVAIHCKDEL